jgi:hypothetical protein
MPAAFVLAVAGATGFTALAGGAIATAIGLGTVSAVTATAIGSAALAGGLTALQGGSVSNVLKSAVIGGVTSFVGAQVASTVQNEVFWQAIGSDVSGSTAMNMANTLAATASGAVTSALRAAATGQDAVKALIQGGLAAGVSTGVSTAVGSLFEGVPTGFMTSATQRAISAALTAKVLDKDPAFAVKNAFMDTALSTVGNYVNQFMKDESSKVTSAASELEIVQGQIERNISYQEAAAARVNTAAGSANTYLTQFNTAKARVESFAADASLIQSNDYVASSNTTESGEVYSTSTYDPNSNPIRQKYGFYGSDIQGFYDGLVNTANSYAEQFNTAYKEYTQEKATFDRYATQYNTLVNTDLVAAQNSLTSAITTFQTQELANVAKVTAALDTVEEIQTLYKEAKGTDIPKDLLDDYLPNLNPSANIANDLTTIDSLVREINVKKEVPDFDETAYREATGIKSWEQVDIYKHYLETGKSLEIPTNKEELAEYNSLKQLARQEGYVLKPEDIKLYKDLDDPEERKAIQQRFDTARLSYAEYAAIAREEGAYLPGDEERKFFAESGSEAELSARLRERLDPLYTTKEEAKQALIDKGFSEKDAGDLAWLATGPGAGDVDYVVTNYSLTATDVKKIAAAEGVTLSFVCKRGGSWVQVFFRTTYSSGY